MMRRKMREVMDLEGKINAALKSHGSANRIFVFRDGEPTRATASLMRITKHGTQMESHLSPRLTTTKMFDWLETFFAGLGMGAALGVAPPPQAYNYVGTEVSGHIFSTHVQECPICGRDLTISCDNALHHGSKVTCACPLCKATLTIDWSEEIAWTITAIQPLPEEGD